MIFRLLVFASVLALSPVAFAAGGYGSSAHLASPDGNLVASFSKDGTWMASYAGKLAARGTFGIETDSGVLEFRGEALDVSREVLPDSAWCNPFGANIVVHDAANALRIHSRSACIDIEIRAYNNALAFRYVLRAGAPAAFATVLCEKQSCTLTGSVPAEGLIRAGAAAWGDAGFPVQAIRPAATPWNVVLLADDTATLQDAKRDIVLSLNEPSKIPDADSWVVPGKLYEPVLTDPVSVQRAIDFCHAHKIRYLLVSAQTIRDYRKAADADPIKFKESPRVRFFLKTDAAKVLVSAESIFSEAQELGVAGLECKSLPHSSDRWAAWFAEFVKSAAKHKLMLLLGPDFSPDGFERTWPNIVAYAASGDNVVQHVFAGMKIPEIESSAGFLPDWHDRFPTVFDCTVTLAAENDFNAVARKKDGVWYVVLRAGGSAKKSAIDFSRFLDSNRNYRAVIFAPKAGGIERSIRTLSGADGLHFDIPPGKTAMVRIISI